MHYEMSEPLSELHIETQSSQPPHPTVTDGRLPLAEIDEIPQVFQPRDIDGMRDAHWNHIEDLGRAIERNGTKGLDPIVVWWSGKRWLVIDGHHRYEAYQLRQWANQDVPVDVFTGSLDQARLESVRRNRKNKLRMKGRDRSQYAWRLVCSSELSKAEIANGTGVSPSTVANMRKRRRECHQIDYERFSDDALAKELWLDVKRPEFLTGQIEKISFDELTSRTTEKWTRAISKHIGPKATRMPEALAMAIANSNEALPEMLINSDAWKEVREEIELADMEEDEDDDVPF